MARRIDPDEEEQVREWGDPATDEYAGVRDWDTVTAEDDGIRDWDTDAAADGVLDWGDKPTVAKKEPEVEYTDRVSNILRDPTEFRAQVAERKAYEEEVGYDEFSQEMESILGAGPEKVEITVQDLAASPKFIDLASRYLTKRVGKEVGNLANYESNEEFVERYLTHTRALSSNMVAVANELSAIRKMSEEDKKDIAKLYQLDPHISAAGSKGGGSLLNAVLNYAAFTVTDPSNFIGIGSGWLVRTYAKHKLSSAAMAEVLRSDTAAMVGTAGVEGALGWMEAGDRQQIDIETGLREGKDLSEMALQATLQAAFGAAGVKAGTYIGATGKSTKEQLDAKLAAGMTDEARELVRKAAKERTRIIDEFDPVLGRRILDDLQGSEAVAEGVVEPQVKRQVANDVYYAVLKWADSNPTVAKELTEAMADENKRISDVVFTLVNSDKLDETNMLDDLRDALAAADVTQEQFADAMRTSISDAAKLMRDARTFKNRLQKIASTDPESAALIARITGADDTVTGATLWDGVKRLDRESRAIMVAGLGTTVRNAMSGTAYMSMKTASNIGEAIMYQMGVGAKALIGKATEAEKARLGIGEMMNDSFGLLYRFARQGESMELADRYLKGQDDLFARLFHEKGEHSMSVTNEISAFAKSVNTLNRVQDSMFRRAVFTERVDFYLRKAKLGTGEDYLRSNKPIPTDILKKATEDSLKATFAYQPRTGRSLGETMAYHVVKFNESLPFVPVIGTADMPFMRFATNAIAFQYKYSPVQFIGAVKDGAGVVSDLVTGKEIDPKQLANFRTKVATSAVGTGMIMAAAQYSKENPELNYYEMKDGQGRAWDLRSVYPAGPYMMAGKFWNQLTGEGGTNRATAKDFLEALSGTQFKTGQLASLDKLVEFAESIIAGDSVAGDWSSEQWTEVAREFGAWSGAQVGRVLTPAQILSDVVAAVDQEENIIRDRNIILSRDASGAAWESFENTLRYKTPILQQELPALKSATREESLYRENSSVRQFIGARVQSTRNPIEEEFTRFGIKSSALIPRNKVGGAADIYREITPDYMELVAGSVIRTDRYKNESNAGKKQLLLNSISKVKELVNSTAHGESMLRTHGKEQTYDFVGRNLWLMLPSNQRKLAMEGMKEFGVEDPLKSKDPYAYFNAIQFANEYFKRYKL